MYVSFQPASNLIFNMVFIRADRTWYVSSRFSSSKCFAFIRKELFSNMTFALDDHQIYDSACFSLLIADNT